MWRPFLLGSFLVAAVALACDPVHSDKVDAIGPDPSGEHNGPRHRAGQECGVCHDGALGDPSEFSVAGTIYVDQAATEAAYGAVVTLTDSKNQTYTLTANEVGNFYVSPKDYAPAYPMQVSVNYSGVNVRMNSVVARGGSCAECHKSPAGPKSAGPVFIPADGGTP
jgi:hypothetical protein